MTIKDFVDDLFGIPHQPAVPKVEYPETAQDGGKPETTPNSDPKYFDPAYPNHLLSVGTLPSNESAAAEWLTATKQGKFIPYVGMEAHGVEIDVDPSALPVNDIDLIAARGHGFGSPVGAPHTIPVPVTVVDTPSFFGIERRFATNQYTLVANTPVLLCGKRTERTRVQISCTALGPLSIGHSVEQVNAGLGFVVPLNVTVTLNTNQPIWVISTVAAVASALEEYTIVEGQKRY